jgi:capsular polysaccharide export protein
VGGVVRGARVGVFSRGVRGLRHLNAFLDAERICFRPSDAQARSLDAIAGWGHKPTSDRARAYAARHGLPYLALEDGFLRSVTLGSDQPPLSVIVDDVGIYYDARRPSGLEQLLAHAADGDPLADSELLARARLCRARILEAKLSKYNDGRGSVPAELDDGRASVLVVDQTLNDASVEQGLAGKYSFVKMLDAAQREHPGARVIVKTHPEVAAGRKKGYLDAGVARGPVTMIAERINPIALLERVRHVYVCTSQLGFEALMAGVPVTCFGAPFYAGWGLTRDRVEISRRGRPRSIDQLVAATLLLYPRYVHPMTGQRCNAEEVIEHLALQRSMFQKNARKFFCFGFSRWKRPFVRRHLSGPDAEVRFASSPKAALRNGLDRTSALVVWGSRQRRDLEVLARQLGVELWRMEDGFLRSVRLGSELTAPGSLVLDTRGIYYDPRTPSDLEALLERETFTADEIDRARKLRRLIVESGVSKYNMAQRRPLRPRAGPGQKVVFVPGQVEDDASVRFGSPQLQSNEALLVAVRELLPEAYILYKPHPDVVIGNRTGTLRPDAHALCDEVVVDAALPDCLAISDEVHTMTSLVGFEALLREIPVVAWGQPFYCGWGLTRDMHPPERRTRKLELDELVAGALLRYPRYYDFRLKAFCRPEEIVAELARLRSARLLWLDRAPWAIRRMHSLAVSLSEWVSA